MRIGKVIKDNRDKGLEKISTSYDLTIEAEIIALLKQLIKVAPLGGSNLLPEGNSQIVLSHVTQMAIQIRFLDL